MARRPRQDHPGAWHHVSHRSARRDGLFEEAATRADFLALLGEAAARFGLEVHGYALLPDRYELLLRTPLANLSRAMRHLNGVFTQQINRARGARGAVFRGRFASRCLPDEGHLVPTLVAIHRLPLDARGRGGLTSHEAYLGRGSRPPWLRTETLLERLGGAARLDLYLAAEEEEAATWPAPRAAPEADAAPAAPATLTAAAAEARALAIADVSAVQARRAVRGRGGNPARRFVVWALSEATDLTQRGIGEHLGMSSNQVAKILARLRDGSIDARVMGWIDAWRDADAHAGARRLSGVSSAPPRSTVGGGCEATRASSMTK